jgi:hypothetical protein
MHRQAVPGSIGYIALIEFIEDGTKPYQRHLYQFNRIAQYFTDDRISERKEYKQKKLSKKHQSSSPIGSAPYTDPGSVRGIGRINSIPLLFINWSVVRVQGFLRIDIRIPSIRNFISINSQVPEVDRKSWQVIYYWIRTWFYYARTLWDVVLDFLRTMLAGMLEAMSGIADLWVQVRDQYSMESGQRLVLSTDLSVDRKGASFYASSSLVSSPDDSTWANYWKAHPEKYSAQKNRGISSELGDSPYFIVSEKN